MESILMSLSGQNQEDWVIDQRGRERERSEVV